MEMSTPDGATRDDDDNLPAGRKSVVNLDLVTTQFEFPEEWTKTRIFLAQVVAARNFDVGMAIIILTNIVCTVREADINAKCAESTDGSCDSDMMVLLVFNNFILCVYGFECLIKLYVLRGAWYLSHWNMFDAVIVLTGIIGEAFSGVLPRTSVVRVLRLARLAKLVRFFIGFRELYLILSGFLSVAKTIIWAAILLFLALTVCSVIAVEYIHPINSRLDYGACDWCANAFETVMKSNVTLFQIVIIGDGWGLFAQPLIAAEPMVGMLLVVLVVFFMLGFANLIMAVIVEKAFESRADDERYQLILQEQEAFGVKAKFYDMCKELDDDGDGTLTRDELINNYDNNRQFLTTLKAMKIDKDDLEMVFDILDADGSGDVEYNEFADNLYKMKSADTTTMLMFIRFNLHSVEKQVKTLREEMIQRLESLPALAATAGSPLHEVQNGHTKEGMEHAPPEIPKMLRPPVDCTKATVHGHVPEPKQPTPLQFDSKIIEEQFFQLRDRVQARLAAVTAGSVQRLEDQMQALARSSQALASLDDAMPLWAGQPHDARASQASLDGRRPPPSAMDTRPSQGAILVTKGKPQVLDGCGGCRAP